MELQKPTLAALSSYFFKLGLTGFGGPLALVAQLQRDLCQQLHWFDEKEFLDLFGLVKMMPGPLASQMSIYIGYRLHGFKGAVMALIGMVAPSFLMMVLLAEFYTQLFTYQGIPQALSAMKLASIALIVLALWSIAKPYLNKWFFWVLSIAAFVFLSTGRIAEPILMAIFGFLTWSIGKRTNKIFSVDAVVILELAKICLYAGAFVFGTGLAIVPFLEGDFVQRLGWITHAEFLDALSFGQMTPGPVIMTVTFLGHKVAGIQGALIATICVFLPCFIHMTTWFPRAFHWLKKQDWLPKVMLGVFAVVVAGIALAIFRFTNELKLKEMIIVAALTLVLVRSRFPSWLLILVSGASGYLLSFVS